MVSKNFRNASGFLFQNLKNQVRAFHSQEVEKDKPDNPSERFTGRLHAWRVLRLFFFEKK